MDNGPEAKITRIRYTEYKFVLIMNKVLIPLAQRKQSEEAVGPMNFARETYIRKLQQYNLLPLFVSHAMNDAAVEMLFDKADGLLLMGGLDVDSSQYTNQPAHEENEPSSVRDELEINLLQQAYEQQMPVLGICRGCQVMAVAAGGQLHQHVPDLGVDETHGESVDGEAYDHVVNIEHTVHIKPDTKLEDIVGQRKITVNSGHHQAVKSPGEGMQVAAESPAGITEAVEHRRDGYFCVGLQSHPEAQQNGPLEEVFRAFQEAVRN